MTERYTDPLSLEIELLEKADDLEGLYTTLLRFIDGGKGSNGYNRLFSVVRKMADVAKRKNDATLDDKLRAAEEARCKVLRQSIGALQREIDKYNNNQQAKIEHETGLRVWTGLVQEMEDAIEKAKLTSILEITQPAASDTVGSPQDEEIRVLPPAPEKEGPTPTNEAQGMDEVQQGLSYLLAFLKEKNPDLSAEKIKQLLEVQLENIA